MGHNGHTCYITENYIKKKHRDLRYVGKMGPLTLLNMDYQILARTFAFRTRMHSSRMRTIRCSSGLLWGGGCAQGGLFRGCLPVRCLPRDVCSGGVCQGCVCLVMCAWQRCLPLGCLPRGCLPREGSVCAPPKDTPGTHPTVNRITEACENIT